jgi:hypothetical protein
VRQFRAICRSGHRADEKLRTTQVSIDGTFRSSFANGRRTNGERATARIRGLEGNPHASRINAKASRGRRGFHSRRAPRRHPDPSVSSPGSWSSPSAGSVTSKPRLRATPTSRAFRRPKRRSTRRTTRTPLSRRSSPRTCCARHRRTLAMSSLRVRRLAPSRPLRSARRCNRRHANGRWEDPRVLPLPRAQRRHKVRAGETPVVPCRATTKAIELSPLHVPPRGR